jgi:hypothetical protein
MRAISEGTGVRPVLPRFVHGDRLMLDLRDARKARGRNAGAVHGG